MHDDSDPTERTMIARRPQSPNQAPQPPYAGAPHPGGHHPGGMPVALGSPGATLPPGLAGGAGMPRSPAEALEPQRAPAPPKGRRIPRQRFRRIGRAMRVLNGVVTFALMAMVGLGAMYYVARTLFDRPGPLAQAKVVVIPQGKGLNDIAEMLEKEEVIHDRRVFTTGHLWFKTTRGLLGGKVPLLKAGEYEIRKGASVRQVLDTLIDGKSILYKLTVAEGLTSFQMAQKVAESQDLTGDIATVPPEGSLLPDTYKFSRGMSRQELLDRMHAEQARVLKSLWEKRQPGLPFKSPEEALIMASIIEKETGRADERDRVAAVFVNRLRQKMRLQSDPTIVYGLTQGAGALGRGILRSEIDQKTPYNTYQIDGLPPTPICNPGRSALEATLNPAKTDELYFVANGQGGHVFARTLAEHNRNVAAFRVTERAAAAAASAAAAPAAEAAPTPTPVTPAVAPQAPKGPTAPAAAKAAAPAVKPAAKPAAAAPKPAQPAQSAPAQASTAADVPLPVRKPQAVPAKTQPAN